MVNVISRVGRLSGKLVDLPYATAQACVSNGTADWPEDHKSTGSKAKDLNGLKGRGSGNANGGSADDPQELPANWRDLPWNEMRNLATILTGNPPKKKVDAIAALEQYENDNPSEE